MCLAYRILRAATNKYDLAHHIYSSNFQETLEMSDLNRDALKCPRCAESP